MKELIFLITLGFLFGFLSPLNAEEDITKPSLKVKSSKYSIQVTIKDIPKGQQTLFVPIKIDTMILDFDKVSLENLSTQNILAVASTSKDKVGPGIGLIKLDDKGLPETLSLSVLLKPTGQGETTISLVMVATEDALPNKGVQINDAISINIKGSNEIEVTEKQVDGKKKLVLGESKLTLEVQRPAQKEESIFIPIIFDKSVIEIDETFGHAIISPGISAKSFSSSSLHEGGPGVEVLLTEVADKDFTLDIDLLPKKVGRATFYTAFPQIGHTAIVTGPTVEINPTSISVASN